MEKSDTEEYLVYNPIYMKFKKRQNESVVIKARAPFCILLWMERFEEKGISLTCKRDGRGGLAEP